MKYAFIDFILNIYGTYTGSSERATTLTSTTLPHHTKINKIFFLFILTTVYFVGRINAGS